MVPFLFTVSPCHAERIGYGTGFFVTSDGYFITCHHVVAGAGKIRVKLGDKEFSAKIIQLDQANDLALLKVEGTDFTWLKIGSGSQVNRGNRVLTIGFPNPAVQGEAAKLNDGIVSSPSGIKDDPRFYQVSVPVQPGNSGGPLVIENAAEVVGIITMRLNDATTLKQSGMVPQNVNFALKSDYIPGLLYSVSAVKESLVRNQEPAGLEEKPLSRIENAVGLIIVSIDGSGSDGNWVIPKPRPEEDVAKMILEFINLGNSGTNGNQIKFFADPVNYFDKGNLSLDKVKSDLQKYQSRWNILRRYQILGNVTVAKGTQGEYIAECALRYEVESNKPESAQGTVMNQYRVRFDDKGHPLIHDVKSLRVRLASPNNRVQDFLSLRQSPNSKDDSNLIGRLAPDEGFVIVLEASKGDFYFVITNRGEVGFVHKSYVRIDD